MFAAGPLVKEENTWRRGNTGEEGGSVRDDGSWRRDGGARSDGTWRKSKAGDEDLGATKDNKMERQERTYEREEHSSWRRNEQVLLV